MICAPSSGRGFHRTADRQHIGGNQPPDDLLTPRLTASSPAVAAPEISWMADESCSAADPVVGRGSFHYRSPPPTTRRIACTLALVQSRGLLFHAAQRLTCSRGLFFGSRGDDLRALLRFARGASPRGCDGLAALGQHDDFLAKLTKGRGPGLFWRVGFGRSGLRRCPRSAQRRSSPSSWILPARLCASRALSPIHSASPRTSSATTAKLRPWSPARAASMAAFNASKLV